MGQIPSSESLTGFDFPILLPPSIFRFRSYSSKTINPFQAILNLSIASLLNMTQNHSGSLAVDSALS